LALGGVDYDRRVTGLAALGIVVAGAVAAFAVQVAFWNDSVGVFDLAPPVTEMVPDFSIPATLDP
jgi:hypothetical protein